MNPTNRLFDTDSYLFSFDAEVIDVIQRKDGRFDIILNKTSFFPEMGGQFGDPGKLDGQEVLDVQINEGVIYHTVGNNIPIGKIVHGEIDRAERFRRMQHHTGEHIVCGIAHRLFGLENVGFHLGHDDVLVDLDGKLTREQLDIIETEANRAVTECRSVSVSFPAPEELPELEYRSKLDLKENVRLVTIDGYDVCACCAPHVGNTGEIGIIKILDFIHYKGGTRLHLLCGSSALKDYNNRYKREVAISNILSFPQDKLVDGVNKTLSQIGDFQKTISDLRKHIIQIIATNTPQTDGNICLFDTETDNLYMRNLANACVSNCTGMCAVFSGNDTDGYKYVIISQNIDLRAIAKDINTAVCGRGGGSSEMISGTATADKITISDFFLNYTDTTLSSE